MAHTLPRRSSRHTPERPQGIRPSSFTGAARAPALDRHCWTRRTVTLPSELWVGDHRPFIVTLAGSSPTPFHVLGQPLIRPWCVDLGPTRRHERTVTPQFSDGVVPIQLLTFVAANGSPSAIESFDKVSDADGWLKRANPFQVTPRPRWLPCRSSTRRRSGPTAGPTSWTLFYINVRRTVSDAPEREAHHE